MKVAEGLKIIEKGWIRKPKGFRVRFDQRTDTGIAPGCSPPPDTAPLTSDVTAWRYAWKLARATQSDAAADRPGALYNILVVDDLDRPIPFYGTGRLERYNPLPVDGPVPGSAETVAQT